MSLSAEDRVALILGRAILRAEALDAQLEATRAEIRELREELERLVPPEPEQADGAA